MKGIRRGIEIRGDLLRGTHKIRQSLSDDRRMLLGRKYGVFMCFFDVFLTKSRSPADFFAVFCKCVAGLCKTVKKCLDIYTLIKYNFLIHYKNVTKQIKNEKTQGMKPMRTNEILQKNEKKKKDSFHSFVLLSLCAVFAIVLAVGSRFVISGDGDRVYAASEREQNEMAASSDRDEYELPTGIAGVVSGMQETPVPGSTVNRIGTSCEQVMVGQRVQTVEERTTELDVSESMASRVDYLDSTAISLASSAKMMTDNDYENLLRIVEAEAGSEDLKGRIMVANVIMNRVKHEEFPDNITDVIYEYKNGVPQFSPVYDGRIDEVTVSDLTREAVKQTLEGVDYSEGALFFIQKNAAEKQNVSWFEKELKRLFKHGVHEFYTYPDEACADKQNNKKKDTESVETVQMVKNDVLS